MKKVLSIFSVFIMAIVGLIPITAQNPENYDEIVTLANELNDWRLSINLSPLVYSPKLEAMAQAQLDYLLSLPEIPADIHRGAQGEYPRERSQFPQFAWEYYGFPANVSVTEIAAIGSINSAMSFWQNSDIHTRSVTNPAYREVGIAVNKLDANNTLYIVVLGSRPNVLPAYIDSTTNTLYLTNENFVSNAPPSWLTNVGRYRLFDETGRMVQDWQEWQASQTLPDNAGNTIFVLYEDGEGKQSLWEAIVDPNWAREELANPVYITATPALNPTNTPNPTVTPAPQATQAPDTVTLVYDSATFTIISTSSDGVDISNLGFKRGDIIVPIELWLNNGVELPINNFPEGHCLRAWSWETSGDFPNPEQCRFVRSIATLSPARLFWASFGFDVLLDDVLIGNCMADVGVCSIEIYDE